MIKILFISALTFVFFKGSAQQTLRGGIIGSTYADSVTNLGSIIPSSKLVTINALGYYIANDGGGGPFYADSNSSYTSIPGMFIPITGKTNWFWVRRIDPTQGYSIRCFGAKGDGVTNDSAAARNMLAYTLNPVIPLGTFRIGGGMGILRANTTLTVYGTIYCDSTVSNAISAIGVPNITIIGFSGSIKCGGSRNNTAIFLDTCNNATVSGVTFYDYNIGIHFYSCPFHSAFNNTFDSAAIDPRWGLPAGQDIDVTGNNNDGSITWNHCQSANGYGVQIRTDSGNIIRRERVSTNTIQGYNSYAILLYKNKVGNSTDGGSIEDCTIFNNSIRNISGARPATPGGSNNIFGTGIYVQGGERITITYNTGSACNSATNSGLLAPAIIGVANSGIVFIGYNTLGATTLGSILINNSLQYGDSSGIIRIIGNIIHNSGQSAISINSAPQVEIGGNQMYNSATFGIFVGNSAPQQLNNWTNIYDNWIDSSLNTNVSIQGVENVWLRNNVSIKSAIHGYAFSGVFNLKVIDCTGSSNLGRGIYLDATNTGNIEISGTFKHNAVGVFSLSPYLYGNILCDSNTTNYSGPFTPGSTLDTTTATPSVALMTYETIGTVTTSITYTNFTGGRLTQEITLVASSSHVTIQNNSNISLSGGANFSMTANQTLTLLYTASGTWVEKCRKT